MNSWKTDVDAAGVFCPLAVAEELLARSPDPESEEAVSLRRQIEWERTNPILDGETIEERALRRFNAERAFYAQIGWANVRPTLANSARE